MKEQPTVRLKHEYLIDGEPVTYPWGRNKLIHIESEKNGTNLHVWWLEDDA